MSMKTNDDLSDKERRRIDSNNKLIQDGEAKWSWACRILDYGNYGVNTHPSSFSLNNTDNNKPNVGDVAIVCVESIGHHRSIITTDNKKLRIYVGDFVVGVFGNRYATDAFEGEVISTDQLSMLTAGGMIGTVKSKHYHDVGKPTKITFIGYLIDEKGQRVNLKRLKFYANKSYPKGVIKNLIIAIGTGMNTGKTTSSRLLIRGLSEKGLKVVACKLTGSVSNRDQDEMRSANARSIMDFSDYGFPSTYLSTEEELIDLFDTMLANAKKLDPDVIVMEIADGILQRETNMLLKNSHIKQKVKGIVLAAESAPSALYSVEYLEQLGYNIVTVCGTMTSSPLSVREFQEHSKIPVSRSIEPATDLVNNVNNFISENK